MYLGKALAEPTTGKSAVDALRSGAELVELLLALQTARLSEEADTGPNYPIELKRLSLRDILVR